MKSLKSIPSILLIYLLIQNATFATQVKLKNGKVLEGTINGLIVQKEETKKSPSEKDPKKVVYNASYYLTNGEEIGLIDEQGVHKNSNKVVIINCSQEETPLNDLDVVETGINAPESPFSVSYTEAGGTVVRIGGRSSNPTSVSKDTLLGVYRADPKTGKGQIILEIEIVTEKGLVKVPIKSIVEFK
ncbi:MAG: hypothetical protein A2315_09370 [Ignavibacteria bacterium RIFOXYB2_FULL_35_12]|nr:MAG: hypothetical protein A2058_04125 [Ignavibacteria bacterium GWA2_36_19]OGU55216.1 MAG: hypothetical protein A2006_04570 [Ignavibacteria bacterium GWC2_35_8]OGU62498.1 MAG: hypothetical protein A2X60_17895 [Ignavibacteria bacterium GWF2_35_20]OGU81731.1 MAG: hypothetical protein A2254_11315 [Ignavibacteria bacterium RIFOXYA2_FULL_35_9]OGU86679.1 MAG: hypothetical protein A3K31_05585 [Ignavibacteria bacterium RIFOXYA12_FULL_35_25]OGU87986.1 MAG: hypothetical protein A2492_13450 [Ignavibac